MNKDSMPLGLVLGVLAPLLGLLIYYFTKFSTFPFVDYMRFILGTPSLLTAMVSVSLLMNAVLFTLFINKRLDKTARGIFAATCAWAIVAILIKFFL